jgi:cell division protein FtsB
MQELFTESENTVATQEAKIVQLEDQNRDSANSIDSLEEKVRQYVQSSHKKELDLVHIKEEMMKCMLTIS